MLISKAIITPGSAIGQTLTLAGLPVPGEPERETSNPGEGRPVASSTKPVTPAVRGARQDHPTDPSRDMRPTLPRLP